MRVISADEFFLPEEPIKKRYKLEPGMQFGDVIILEKFKRPNKNHWHFKIKCLACGEISEASYNFMKRLKYKKCVKCSRKEQRKEHKRNHVTFKIN